MQVFKNKGKDQDVSKTELQVNDLYVTTSLLLLHQHDVVVEILHSEQPSLEDAVWSGLKVLMHELCLLLIICFMDVFIV
jgi:hypothetical protein